eukprot:998484_1
MCPLRYILIILSVGFALLVVIGGAAYTPEFVLEAEQKRKDKNRKWYETLWDFAWGKFLVDLWTEAVKTEEAKDNLINNIDTNNIGLKNKKGETVSISNANSKIKST